MTLDRSKLFFLGIGAAKAGTSWLGQYLTSHPDVTMSPVKELHYFDAVHVPQLCGHWFKKWQTILPELVAKYSNDPSSANLEKIRCVTLRLEMQTNPKAYAHYFDCLCSESASAFGEITPSYSLLPKEGFQAILDIYPGARFVFLARDPVDRLLSQIQFLRHESNQSSGNALNDGKNNDAKYLESPYFLLRSDYRKTLSTLYSVAAPERVLVIMYEHLFDTERHAYEVRRLCDFLDIAYHSSNRQQRVNASEKLVFDAEFQYKCRQKLTPVYEYMQKHFAAELPNTWRF